MGRRLRGAKLRAEKRGKISATEIVETQAAETETLQVSTKPDEELFVIDTKAVAPSKKQVQKKENKKRKYEPSAKEQVQIQKLIETHSTEKLQEMSKKANATAKYAKVKGSVTPSFDLWGTEEGEKESPGGKGKNTRNPSAHPGIGSTLAGIKPEKHTKILAKKALPNPTKQSVNIDVAKSGQSYNPDQVEHKKIIQEAIQVESKRVHAEKIKKAPISTGMSAETRALLVGDSDTDDSDSEDEGGDAGDDALESQPIEKKKEKLTRAQRNKQKRLRAEEHEIQERKRQKKLQNSVGEAKTIAKQLRKKEEEERQKKEQLEKLKEEKVRVKGKNVYQQLADENPIDAPTFPVALKDELKSGGSLRTLRPKGSLLQDRLASFVDRGMAAKKVVIKNRKVQGKRRKAKLKVKGKGFKDSRENDLLG